MKRIGIWLFITDCSSSLEIGFSLIRLMELKRKGSTSSRGYQGRMESFYHQEVQHLSFHLGRGRQGGA